MVLERSWSAHEFSVNSLAKDEVENVLYSCSLEGEIKKWEVGTGGKEPVCVASAVQTVSGGY